MSSTLVVKLERYICLIDHMQASLILKNERLTCEVGELTSVSGPVHFHCTISLYFCPIVHHY